MLALALGVCIVDSAMALCVQPTGARVRPSTRVSSNGRVGMVVAKALSPGAQLADALKAFEEETEKQIQQLEILGFLGTASALAAGCVVGIQLQGGQPELSLPTISSPPTVTASARQQQVSPELQKEVETENEAVRKLQEDLAAQKAAALKAQEEAQAALQASEDAIAVLTSQEDAATAAIRAQEEQTEAASQASLAVDAACEPKLEEVAAERIAEVKVQEEEAEAAAQALPAQTNEAAQVLKAQDQVANAAQLSQKEPTPQAEGRGCWRKRCGRPNVRARRGRSISEDLDLYSIS